MIPNAPILWQPSAERIDSARITHFIGWLTERGYPFAGYADLWQWSVTEPAAFWQTVADYFDALPGQSVDTILTADAMPDTQWFVGARANFAERALRRTDDAIALVAAREDGCRDVVTWQELRNRVAAVAAGLRAAGVERGDRVAGILTTSTESVLCFLATASVGAIWSCCSPEFGTRAIIDRLVQVQPKVLFAAASYVYGGKSYATDQKIQDVVDNLPNLERVVRVDPYAEAQASFGTEWADFVVPGAELRFEPTAFDAPLWIVYSSGTTGLPKPIVHGHGGMLLNLLLLNGIQMGLGPDDLMLWYTSTAWIMWNLLVSALLTGTGIVLFDGSPTSPDANALWALTAELGVSHLGHGAGWYQHCKDIDLRPSNVHDLSRLRFLGSTGSPLSPDVQRWLHDVLGPQVQVVSASGGTDVAGPLVTGCEILPIREGEIQCRALGVDAQAWSPGGEPLPPGETGELVVPTPIPSMPLGFWGDRDNRRYRAAYFDIFPGVWRHGDWIEFTPSGGAIIHGRSDATLNRNGVRMGSAEFYRVVEVLTEITDSLVVDVTRSNYDGQLVLFVQTAPGLHLDGELRARINRLIRNELSPRHVPDLIVEVSEIPYTATGKKCEVPLKRVLLGDPLSEALDVGTLRNPQSIEELAAAYRFELDAAASADA